MMEGNIMKKNKLKKRLIEVDLEIIDYLTKEKILPIEPWNSVLRRRLGLDERGN